MQTLGDEIEDKAVDLDAAIDTARVVGQYQYLHEKVLPIPIPILLQKSIGNTDTNTFSQYFLHCILIG